MSCSRRSGGHIALSLLFVFLLVPKGWSEEGVALTLEDLRQSAPGMISPEEILWQFSRLVKEAEGVEDPAQRQREFLMLAETGKTFGKSDYWRLRCLREVIESEDGEARWRKDALLLLAEAYLMGLGHDLPYLDKDAYVAKGAELVEEMLADATLQPWRPEILQMKGRIHSSLKEQDKALEAYREAIEILSAEGNENPWAWRQYAGTLFAMGRRDEALELAESAASRVVLAEDPMRWLELQELRLQFLRGMGEAERHAEGVEQVRSLWEGREASHDERSRYLRLMEGSAYQDESRRALEQLMRESPDSPSLRLDVNNEARNLVRSGDIQKARELVGLYQAARPQDRAFGLGMLAALAKTLNEAGDHEKAQALADEVVADALLDGTHPIRQLGLAAHMRQGGLWPSALLQAGFQNATDLLGALESPEEQLEILRKIALAGFFFNDVEIMDYAVRRSNALPRSPDLDRDLLDIQFLEACLYQDRKQPDKAREIAQRILDAFPPGPERKNTEDLLGRLEGP